MSPKNAIQNSKDEVTRHRINFAGLQSKHKIAAYCVYNPLRVVPAEMPRHTSSKRHCQRGWCTPV